MELLQVLDLTRSSSLYLGPTQVCVPCLQESGRSGKNRRRRLVGEWPTGNCENRRDGAHEI